MKLSKYFKYSLHIFVAMLIIISESGIDALKLTFLIKADKSPNHTYPIL